MNKERDPKKCRILLVTHSMRYGGAENVFLNILKHLDRDVFIPYVACPSGPMLEKVHPLCEGLVIARRGIFPSRFDLIGYLIAAYAILPNTIALARFIRRNNISLVFTNTSVVCHGMFAAWAVGIPSVVMIHETISPIILRKLLFRLIYSISDKVILISNAMQKTFIPSGDQSKITRVHEAIDLSEVNPSSDSILCDQYEINGKTSVVGIIGYLSPIKGQHYFIRMAAEVTKVVKDIKFLIVAQYDSNSQYYRKLLRLCEKLGVSDYIRFTGFVPDLMTLMNRLDIVTICSVTEGMSLVALEAMALRKPVVTYDVGGMAEAVIDGVNGRVIPYGDYRAMAQAVITILQNKQIAVSMGQEGRKIAEENFEIEIQRKKLKDVLVRTLNSQ